MLTFCNSYVLFVTSMFCAATLCAATFSDRYVKWLLRYVLLRFVAVPTKGGGGGQHWLSHSHINMYVLFQITGSVPDSQAAPTLVHLISKITLEFSRRVVQRWNSWTVFLIEASGHKLESCQTKVFAWFSTLIFSFYKKLFINRLKFSYFANFLKGFWNPE